MELCLGHVCSGDRMLLEHERQLHCAAAGRATA